MHTAVVIERILTSGKTASTYKYALLHAIVDVLIEQPARIPQRGIHALPIIDLARRVLARYWRSYATGVPQAPLANGQGIPFRREFELLIQDRCLPDRCYGPRNENGALTLAPDAGTLFLQHVTVSERLHPNVVEALVVARNRLIDFPIKHAPNLPGGPLNLWMLLRGHGLLASDHEEFATSVRGAKTTQLKRCVTWPELIGVETAGLGLSLRAWDELLRFRFWLREAIQSYWLKRCEVYASANTTNMNITPPSLGLLDLGTGERDTTAIDRFRELCGSAGVGSNCFWSNRRLTRTTTHIDHLLPWSRMPVDLFWNLAPVHRDENLRKSDALPVLNNDVKERYISVMARLVQTGSSTIIADLRTTQRLYLGAAEAPLETPFQTAEVLWSMFEASHHQLVEAGAPLWVQER